MKRIHSASLRVLLAFSALLLLTVLTVGSASAHAHIKSSSPSDGEVLTTEPTTVSAVYEEETSLTKTVFDVSYAKDASATPKVVAQGTVDVNARTNVSASLPAGLGDGIYSVKWRSVTEEDNGIVDGTFSFTVASGASATGPTGQTGSEVEQPETTTTTTTTPANPGTLPVTGQADALPWTAALVLGSVLLGGGLVMRRRAAR